MSLKDLEPLQPSSPFYPPFIPTGSEIPPLQGKGVKNNSVVLNTATGQLLVTQAMEIPIGATIIYYTVQNVGQNAESCPPFNPYVKISDISYSSGTGNMTWYVNWDGLAGSNRPIYLCSVYYYL